MSIDCNVLSGALGAKEDARSLLAPGKHLMDLARLFDVAVRPFLPDARRDDLWERFKELLARIRRLGLQGAMVWVGGSFLTENRMPHDFDMVVWPAHLGRARTQMRHRHLAPATPGTPNCTDHWETRPLDALAQAARRGAPLHPCESVVVGGRRRSAIAPIISRRTGGVHRPRLRDAPHAGQALAIPIAVAASALPSGAHAPGQVEEMIAKIALGRRVLLTLKELPMLTAAA
jgi:hypothetical protein